MYGTRREVVGVETRALVVVLVPRLRIVPLILRRLWRLACWRPCRGVWMRYLRVASANTGLGFVWQTFGFGHDIGEAPFI